MNVVFSLPRTESARVASILRSPEKKKADPAVLKGLCSHTLPSGKNEVLVHEFESWASVQREKSLQFDWDDALGNKERREAGLRLEKMRQVRVAAVAPRAAAPRRLVCAPVALCVEGGLLACLGASRQTPAMHACLHINASSLALGHLCACQRGRLAKLPVHPHSMAVQEAWCP
jgi:hypothetical protein